MKKLLFISLMICSFVCRGQDYKLLNDSIATYRGDTFPVPAIYLSGNGFGGVWSVVCPTCKEERMQVVRPGKVACSKCG